MASKLGRHGWGAARLHVRTGVGVRRDDHVTAWAHVEGRSSAPLRWAFLVTIAFPYMVGGEAREVNTAAATWAIHASVVRTAAGGDQGYRFSALTAKTTKNGRGAVFSMN